MVTFKRGWGRLYYTQYTLLSNVRQLSFFFRNKHIHTQGRGKGVLTQKMSLGHYSSFIITRLQLMLMPMSLGPTISYNHLVFSLLFHTSCKLTQ